MDRSTFGNVTEIKSFLEGLGIEIPREDSSISGGFPQLPVTGDVMSHLESMMKRRHHIVHRADRTQTGVLQEISEADVLLWLVATLNLTLNIATVNFTRRHSLEEFQKEVRRVVPATDSSATAGPAEEAK